jgi:hypothetical protein
MIGNEGSKNSLTRRYFAPDATHYQGTFFFQRDETLRRCRKRHVCFLAIAALFAVWQVLKKPETARRIAGTVSRTDRRGVRSLDPDGIIQA